MSTPEHHLRRLVRVDVPKLDEVEGTILLPIRKDRLKLTRDQLEADGREFQQKPEVHVTIVGRKVGKLLLEADCGKGLVFQAVQELIDRTDWTVKRSGEFVQLYKRKPVEDSPEFIDARSVIEMVGIPAGEGFFADLSAIVGTLISPPPFHMTLYTHADHEGIGVSSKEDLERYTDKPLEGKL